MQSGQAVQVPVAVFGVSVFSKRLVETPELAWYQKGAAVVVQGCVWYNFPLLAGLL